MTTNPAPITEAPLTSDDLGSAPYGYTRIGDRNMVGVVNATGLNTVAYLIDLPDKVQAAIAHARVMAQVTGSVAAEHRLQYVGDPDRNIVARWIAEGHERSL